MGLELNGLSKGQEAQHRDGQEFTFRKNAIEIFKVGRNKFNVAPAVGEMIEAGAKVRYFFTGAAGSFRKKYQRVRLSERPDEIFNQSAARQVRFFGVFRFGCSSTFDQNGLKYPFTEIAA